MLWIVYRICKWIAMRIAMSIWSTLRARWCLPIAVSVRRIRALKAVDFQSTSSFPRSLLCHLPAMISSFAEPIPVSSSTYQTTSSGNLISVRARIYGATAIVLHGRNVVEPGVILRGDLRRFLGTSSASSKKESDGQMAIVMGRYCRIGEDSMIRPPGKMTKG